MKWLPIREFPCYEISDEGTVRRIDTQKVIAQNTKKGKAPYQRVHLSHDGKAKYVLVHRLVLLTFVGECPDGCETLHLNDNHADNRLSNLKWGTRKDNHKTIDRKGKANGRAILTEDDVLMIRTSDETNKSLAAHFGRSVKYIQNIKRGINWTHIQPA